MTSWYFRVLVHLTGLGCLSLCVMIYELVLRNFICSLEFVFSLLLLQPFKFSPVSFACNCQD